MCSVKSDDREREWVGQPREAGGSELERECAKSSDGGEAELVRRSGGLTCTRAAERASQCRATAHQHRGGCDRDHECTHARRTERHAMQREQRRERERFRADHGDDSNPQRVIARREEVHPVSEVQCTCPSVPADYFGAARGIADAVFVLGGIMKLYYSPGACSLAPHIALREAERTFELERVDLRSHRTATGRDFLAFNSKGYVPALQLNGPGSVVLTENAAILQYIADLAPQSGLAPPAGTFARYHLQEWLSFISGELHKQFSPLFMPDTPVPTQERARGKIGQRLVYMNEVLVDRGFVMGETFTVADCYLFAILRWGDRFELDLTLWPNVAGYFERVAQRPAVHAALDAEGLVERKRIRRSA